jgi:hypothetical protein
MKQVDVIKILGIHIPFNTKNQITVRKRLESKRYCFYAEMLLIKGRNDLVKNLNSLIADNYIECEELRESGCLPCLKQGLHPNRSYDDFQTIMQRRFSVKEKVIDNMLYAINLIDYSVNFKHG